MEGTRVWRRHGYGGDMGMERDKGIEEIGVGKGQSYGRDMSMEGTRVWSGKGTEGIRVWRGQEYGGDTGKEGTNVWKGQGY